MQAAQNPFTRFRVIVLHKGDCFSQGFFKAPLVKTFKEKAALVTQYLGLEYFYIGNGCIYNVHYLAWH